MTPSEKKNLLTFTDKILAGEPLSQEGATQLDELLRCPEARDFYLKTIELDSALPDALNHAEIVSSLEKKVISPKLPWAVAAAVALSFFMIGFFARQPSSSLVDTPPATTTAAHDSTAHLDVRIIGMVGVRWKVEPDSLSTPNTINLESGLVELEYPTGTRVILQGPAKYEITGDNNGEISHGRFVAHVPDGAEGFTVDYPNGRIVDLGTEFGFDLSRSGRLELGVFHGEVEMHLPTNQEKILLTQNHAVEQLAARPEQVSTIPFDRDRFIRETPTREFAWQVERQKKLHFTANIDHLIYQPGKLRAVFKWVTGPDIIKISAVKLLHNGRPIDTSEHSGAAGYLEHTRNNIFDLTIPTEGYEHGGWTIEATLETNEDKLANQEITRGSLLIEDLPTQSFTMADYTGEWTYFHDGKNYNRVHLPDGTLQILENGQLLRPGFTQATWKVEDGIMRVWIPHLNEYEDLILRDTNTLIFTDQPYRQALRSNKQKNGK